MAESTLSINYEDLKNAVRRYLGYAVDDSDNDTEVDYLVQSGIRNFYYPHAVDGVDPGFEWSFLKPTKTLVLSPSVADYDLPDDFGHLPGNLYYEMSVHLSSIVIVSLSQILSLRQQSDRQGTPRYAAIRHKETDGTTGQIQEICFWPTPLKEYTLKYSYEAYNGKLTDENPYPAGGMKHSELVKESCLAAAERESNDEIGIHDANFKKMLVTAVARDMKNGAHYFGSMAGADSDSDKFDRSNGLVSYKGNTW